MSLSILSCTVLLIAKLRRREVRFHVFSVLHKTNPLSSAVNSYAAKLAPKFSGPYTVVRVV